MDVREKVIRRFKVKVLHQKGFNVRDISERTGVHPRTVRKILSSGRLFPSAYERVVMDLERFPFSTVEERAERLGVSKGYVSRMYKLVFFTEGGGGEEWMAEYLADRGFYELAAKLLEILPFSYTTFGIINSIPEVHLTPRLKILKLHGQVVFGVSACGWETYRESFHGLIEDLKREGLWLSYYHALYTYMNALMLQEMWQEVYEMASGVEDDFALLPTPLALNFYAIMGKLAITLGYHGKFREILSRVRHKVGRRKTFVHLRKKVALDLIVSDGKYSHATRYSLKGIREPDATLLRCLLLLQMGKVREVVREDVSHVGIPLYRFYLSVIKGYARLVLGYVSNALSDVGKAYRRVDGLKSAKNFYYQFMAFYEAKMGRFNRSQEYIRGILGMSKGYGIMGRVAKALLTRRTSHLSGFTREKLLKLIMEDKVEEALHKAKRYAMLFDLSYFSTLAGKPLRVNFAL